MLTFYRPALALAVFCWVTVSVHTQMLPKPPSRLAAAGRLWATVKYFHPSAVAAAPGEWDAALLESIPRVQSART